MPLNRDRRELGLESQDLVVKCVHCHQMPDRAKTVGLDEKLVYELMCPSGGLSLGSWSSEREMVADIDAFRSTAMCSCGHPKSAHAYGRCRGPEVPQDFIGRRICGRKCRHFIFASVQQR